MAWSQRGSRSYFYLHQRVNGRPVRRYVGAAGSPAATLAAADADQRRLAREAAARERHAERERLREAEAALLELCEASDIVARAALVGAGYHRHGGEWRRGREPERAE
jgi:hypothetical protein